MRNLMIIFLTMMSFASIEAQTIFQAKKMITVNDDNEEIKNINSKIVINSDTTEIEIVMKSAKIKEKIGKLRHNIQDGIYKTLVYYQEYDILIIKLENEKIFSITFQSDMYKSLKFE